MSKSKAQVVLTGYASHANRSESLSYYLHEMKSIRESKIFDLDSSVLDGDEETDDREMDPNAEWLRMAGFENIVYMLETASPDDDGMLDSSELENQTAALPESHAAAIKQRMHTLRSTIKLRNRKDRRKKSVNYSDVRDMFVQPPSVSDQTNGHSRQSPSLPLSLSEPTSTTTSYSPSHPSPQKPSNGLPSKNSGVSRQSSSSITDIKLPCRLPSPTSSQSSLGTLPNISLDSDPLGITHVHDLSERDMEKVRCLAHIELSITFEENNLHFRPLRAPKLKHINEDQIFGVPLANLLENDRKRDPKAYIPLLLKEMFEYLERHALHDEGILRVPGSAARIREMQEEIEARFNCGVFSFEGRKMSDVSSLLKQFIRDLPVPLLPREYLSAFVSIADIGSLKEQVRTLNLLVLMMPQLHQNVLKRLLIFCDRVHQQRDLNKMDMTNISMVLAPNLFCSIPSSKLGCDDVTLAAKTSHVMLLLIKYHHVLWMVPGGMLHQVRFLYESDPKKISERTVKQLLTKMPHDQPSSKSRSPPENGPHIIRVKAPLFTCVCKAVNIHENPTAGSVVAKLRRRSQLNRDAVKRISTPTLPDHKRISGSSLSDHSCSSDSLDEVGTDQDIDVTEQFLFEVGGNIGERCLDNDTNMKLALELNPHAHWIIKPRNCPEL